MAAWKSRLLSACGVVCLTLAIAWATLNWSAGRLRQAQLAQGQAEAARTAASHRLQEAKLAEAVTRQAIAQFEALLASGAIGRAGAPPTPLAQHLASAFPGLTLRATGSDSLGKADKRAPLSRQVQHWQLTTRVRHEEQFIQLLAALQTPAKLTRVRSCQLAPSAEQASSPGLHVHCELEQLRLDIAPQGARS